jgi:hypothetical protein
MPSGAAALVAPSHMALLPWIPQELAWGYGSESLTLHIRGRMHIKSPEEGPTTGWRTLMPPWLS